MKILQQASIDKNVLGYPLMARGSAMAAPRRSPMSAGATRSRECHLIPYDRCRESHETSKIWLWKTRRDFLVVGEFAIQYSRCQTPR